MVILGSDLSWGWKEQRGEEEKHTIMVNPVRKVGLLIKIDIERMAIESKEIICNGPTVTVRINGIYAH